VARFDLVPDPTAPGAASLDEQGTIVGPLGWGLALLFSERFRFCLGEESRRVADRFEPHPLGRAFVSGRKCIPWMHHPHVPHAILERPDVEPDACDWLMVMGARGPGHEWGDGTEANYPQYGIRRTVKVRRDAPWEDGVVLELALAGADGRERDLAGFDWQLRHVPGRVTLRPIEAGPVAAIELAAPSGERAGRVRVRWSSKGGATGDGATLVARARFLAKRLTVAPPDAERPPAPIDVLDAPFGFQRFEEHALAPRAIAGGVAFDVRSLGVSLFFAASGAARATWSDVDGDSKRFDVELRVARPVGAGRLGESASSDLVFGVEDSRDPARTAATALAAPIDATARDLEEDGADGRPRALRLESGERWLDGLVRWSRHVAHALVAPNGVIMTGALGYSAKSHVGQDVPFVLPLFLLDPHPRLARAARRMLELVVESPSARAPDGRGILDHPCEGRDFAFLPMRPRSARIFRPIGAAGLFRWILVLERHAAASGDDELTTRALALLADKVERHHLPFDLGNECWSAGEETQELAYSLPAAFDALAALRRMLERLDLRRAARLAEPIEAARAAIRAQLERPIDDGGLRLARSVTRGEATLAAGWLAPKRALERDAPWFGFDVPLVAAHALVHGALSPDHERRLARLLADPDGCFRVRGAGIAKCPGGGKGVWWWHNSLAAIGLAKAGELDAAFDLLELAARGLADVNGWGIPGEETNGGDHAMGIGALGGLAALEVLLGIECDGARLRLRPRLPSRLDGFRVRGLRAGPASTGTIDVEVRRRGEGPLVASEGRTIGAAERAAGRLLFELS
jgi:hypothetical protein